MVNSGYGRPFLYFMLRCLGVAIENTRRMRRLLRGRIWLARAWTFAVVVLPVGLFLHRGFVDRYLVATLVARGLPGLERSLKGIDKQTLGPTPSGRCDPEAIER